MGNIAETQEKYTSLIELLNAWFGGAATTLIAVFVSRSSCGARTRCERCDEILWQGIVLGNADRSRHGSFIGEGLATWLALGQPMATGMIAALAYLGPRGSEVPFMWWLAVKVEKCPSGHRALKIIR